MKSLNVILAMLALILINVIVSFNSKNILILRHSRKHFTKETIEGLESIRLKNKMRVSVFYDNKSKEKLESFYSLLKNYLNSIDIDFYDPDLHPEMVRKFDVNMLPTSVFEYGNRNESLESHNELSLINLINRLTGKNNTRIFFTKGHGELSIYDKSTTGISHLHDELTASNIKFIESDLLNKIEIESSDVIVIAGPKNDLSEIEFKKIIRGIYSGARLALFVDPYFLEGKFYYINKLMTKYNLSIRPGFIRSVDNFVDGSNGLAPIFSNNLFISSRSKNSRLFFPFSTAIFSKKSNSSYFGIGKNNSIFLSDINALDDSKKTIPDLHNYFLAQVASVKFNENFSKAFAIGNSTFLQNKFKDLMNSSSLFSEVVNRLSKDKSIQSLNIPNASSQEIAISKRLSFISIFLGAFCFFILIFFFLRKVFNFKDLKLTDAQ